MELCVNCGAELDETGVCGLCLLGGALQTNPTMTPTEGIPAGTQSGLEYDDFGNYQIQMVLGEGGMGTVYLAEQTAPIRRMVALKVVKLGMDTNNVLSRFAYERQSVALMDHPNIARVYDAGATVKGRPYFVMEYVDGIPITRYCDEKFLTTQERLRLFVPVCEAVQHAHQKGIIHRDLKPSNVLVMEVDGHPVAKVIDFGIAKAMNQAGSDATMLTELGQFVGTPDYMSPEQADVMSGAVDATSDVYSLGVMLYELLAGAVPFDCATLRKNGMVELLRIIREVEAPAMPVKLTGLGATAADIAGRRRTALVALRRELSGDLNWIVMKAVEKARERRYQSVAELAGDINRHLDDRPVLASPPSRLYRIKKFVRRNKVAVFAGAVASAALFVGFGTAVWQAGVARNERTIAVQQRQRAEASGAEAIARGREAEIEKKRAEESAADARREQQLAEDQGDIAVQQSALAQSRLVDVSALANSMIFEIGEGLRDLSGTTATRELMVRRGVEYLNRMSAQNPGGAAMRQQMGAAWLKVAELQYDPGRSSLYDTEGSRLSLERSIALLEPLLDGNPRDPELRHLMLQAYRQRAILERTDAGRQGRLNRSLQIAEQAVADKPADLRAQADLADVFQSKEDYRRAVEIRQRILAADTTAEEDPPAEIRWRLCVSQVLLGTSLYQKDDDLALKTLEPALNGLEALVREEPGNVQYQRDRSVAMTQLGIELTAHNRTKEALERAGQGVALITPLAAADPNNAGFQMDLSLARSGLGAVQIKAGRNAEALDTYQKALAVQESEAADHPDNPEFVAMAAKIHSVIAGQVGIVLRDPQATLSHRRAAETLYRRLVKDHPARKEYARALSSSVGALGEATAAAGNRAAAMESFREALQLAEKLCSGTGVSEEDWTARAVAHRGMAAGAQLIGRTPDAMAEVRLAIADYERVVANNPKAKPAQEGRATSWRDLAALHLGRGENRQAVDALLKAMPFLEAQYAASGPGDLSKAGLLSNALNQLGRAYSGLGEYDRAIEAGKRCLDIAVKFAAAEPGNSQAAVSVAAAQINIGFAYRNAIRRDDVIASDKRAWEALDKFPMEKLDTPILRLQWTNMYGAVINSLDGQEEREGLSTLCRRVIAVIEPIYKAEPGNQRYRTELVDAYGVAVTVLGNGGQNAEAVDLAQKAATLAALAPVKNASYWNALGTRYVRIGSLQLRLGQAKESAATWAQAMDSYKRGREEAAKVNAANGRDRSALTDLAVAARGIAGVAQLSGNKEEALKWNKELIARAKAEGEADPADPANIRNLRVVRASAVRFQWLISGEKGDYRSILEKEATPAQVRQELALGWLDWSAFLDSADYLFPARVEAARTAVDLYRKIDDSTPVGRADRAYAIGRLGRALLRQSAAATAGQKAGQLREALKFLTEARGMLQDLNRVAPLSASDRARLVNIGNDLAAANAKLASPPAAIWSK